MKLTKRFLCLMLCLCMVLPFLPATRTQAASYNNLVYSIRQNQVIITYCSGNTTGAFTIPSTIQGYPVTTIDEVDKGYVCAESAYVFNVVLHLIR